MPSIIIKETEHFDIGLRKFKRAYEKAAIVPEIRAREFYEKPIDQFTKGNRPDLAEIEKVELDILSAYKPAQLDESEIVAKVKAAINETGAESMQDIGKVMGVLKGPLAGSADMGLVSKIVKDQLS